MTVPGLQSLKGKTSFDAVFRRCRKFSNGAVYAHVRFLSSEQRTLAEQRPPVRIGLMMRKRFIPRAVDRNRLKRLFRAALGELFLERPELFGSIDAMILSWNTQTHFATSSLRMQELREMIETLMQQPATLQRRTTS